MTKAKIFTRQATSKLLVSLLCFLTANASALNFQQENSETTTSQNSLITSIGQKNTALTVEQRKVYWQQNKNILVRESRVLPSPITIGTTRKAHIIHKKNTNKKPSPSAKSNQGEFNANTLSSFSHYDSFSIYNAVSYLLDDIDGDGYYQSFSIVFDADFYSTSPVDYANVYAELYLSRDGGPWIHYYTTDIFTIHGESEEDEYEVISTLDQGFINDTYDILIDLYDADYDELVVSYNSDDDNALYALPLESNNFDQLYETEVIYTQGGSTSVFILFLIGVAIFIRQHRYL